MFAVAVGHVGNIQASRPRAAAGEALGGGAPLRKNWNAGTIAK